MLNSEDMFTQIKTSSANKIVVSELSRKFNLATENVIARIAYTYSLSKSRKLDLLEIQDSSGKEYSKNVLFGNNYPYYVSMLCVHYGIHENNKDIPRYIKMHIDDGLELINAEVKDNPNLSGFDYLIDKIEEGLNGLC